MEGITYWPQRRALSAFFPGCDRYYTPFIAVNSTHSFKTREKKELYPGNNAGIFVVPQLLTNDADAFLWAADAIRSSGYKEMNFNLGCPSPTVVTHGKGAGFLMDPEKLDRFFETVFSKMAPDILLSVKTRLGMEDEEEAEALLTVYNRYPIDRLIVHPRLRKDYYKGRVRLDAFGDLLTSSRHPVIYNGDIFTTKDAEAVRKAFPGIRGVMCGRGLLMNPSLARELKGGEPFTKSELKGYHDLLIDFWLADIPEFSGVIGKMKEIWHYLGPAFRESEKRLKKIRKSRRKEEYLAAVEELFLGCDLLAPEERTWRP